jgi:ketosteroid isomerase-like protein
MIHVVCHAQFLYCNLFVTIKPIKMETTVMTNKEMAQAVYDYFGQGNVAAILELVTDDIKWTCPGPTEILPYAQVYNGKKGVEEFFRLIYANKDFPAFEVKELIGENDKVVALGRWDAKSKKTGNAYSGDWAMVFSFRDGKLCEHKEYYDSYSEAMASKE